jgi:O-antigen/teichoic acid export membrane protein
VKVRPAAAATPRHRRADGLDDGLALSISAGLGSLAGLLGWILSTRLFEPAEVGQAAKVVAAFILIAGICQLNVSVGTLRWVPTAGAQTSKVIWSLLLLIMPLGGLVALVYVLLLPDIGHAAAGKWPFWVGVLLFVGAAAGWTVFVVHDTILVAIGKPWWAVWRNALFAVIRLGLLIGLAVAGLGAQGIVLSWAVPIVVWIAVGSLVLVVLARRISREASGGTLPDRRAAVAFLGPTAVAQMGTSLLYGQVTVLAAERFGDATGAKFFMAWQAVTVVDLSATYFMNSLAVGVAREPYRAAELAAVTRKRLMMIFLPVLAIGCVVAGPALWLVFGPEYAEAADVLRLLFVGLAFRLVILHELGVLQALGRGFAYARLQLISTVLVVLVAAVVPVGESSINGLIPVAIGYIAVQVVCAAAVLWASARSRPTAVEVVSP